MYAGGGTRVCQRGVCFRTLLYFFSHMALRNTTLSLNLEERNRNFAALNASHQEFVYLTSSSLVCSTAYDHTSQSFLPALRSRATQPRSSDSSLNFDYRNQRSPFATRHPIFGESKVLGNAFIDGNQFYILSRNIADLDMSATRLRSLEMQLHTTQSEVEHSNLEMKLMASSKDE